MHRVPRPQLAAHPRRICRATNALPIAQRLHHAIEEGDVHHFRERVLVQRERAGLRRRLCPLLGLVAGGRYLVGVCVPSLSVFCPAFSGTGSAFLEFEPAKEWCGLVVVEPGVVRFFNCEGDERRRGLWRERRLSRSKSDCKLRYDGKES